MHWREVVEWIVILLIIVAWWPRIFLGYGHDYDPMWYHVLTHYISPLILIIIVILRWRRMQAGFRYSEEMMKQQQLGRPGPDKDGQDAGAGKDAGRPSLPFMPPPTETEDDDDSR